MVILYKLLEYFCFSQHLELKYSFLPALFPHLQMVFLDFNIINSLSQRNLDHRSYLIEFILVCQVTVTL